MALYCTYRRLHPCALYNETEVGARAAPHLEIASGQDVPLPPPHEPDLDGLGHRPQNARKCRNYLAWMESESEKRRARARVHYMGEEKKMGVIFGRSSSITITHTHTHRRGKWVVRKELLFNENSIMLAYIHTCHQTFTERVFSGDRKVSYTPSPL